MFPRVFHENLLRRRPFPLSRLSYRSRGFGQLLSRGRTHSAIEEDIHFRKSPENSINLNVNYDPVRPDGAP